MKNSDLLTALFFKKTLLHILKNNEGVVISVDNDIKPFYPNQDKILVFKYNDNIHILDYEGDLNDGEIIEIELDEDN